MSLIIEAGKSYKTRDGRKVGPAEAYTSHSDVYPMCRWVVNGYLYQNDGTFADGGEEHSFDLIAEWHEGPVRTRTVTEIVDGNYGVVHIAVAKDGRVQVGIGAIMGEAELTAAIETLTQIRDAMKEENDAL